MIMTDGAGAIAMMRMAHSIREHLSCAMARTMIAMAASITKMRIGMDMSMNHAREVMIAMTAILRLFLVRARYSATMLMSNAMAPRMTRDLTGMEMDTIPAEATIRQILMRLKETAMISTHPSILACLSSATNMMTTAMER
jgi:hypothetical protein